MLRGLGDADVSRCAVGLRSRSRFADFCRVAFGGFPVAVDRVDGRTNSGLGPRSLPIEMPMPGYARQPRVRSRNQPEAGDRPLQADLVAVEQLDGDRLGLVDPRR